VPPARQAGFTLIEVLVAMAILSVAVVASIQGFAQGLRLIKLAGDHQQAMLLADQKVREFVDVKEVHDQGTEGLLRWERIARPIETPELSPALGGARVYEIGVRVMWDPQRQVEIRTVRMVMPNTNQFISTIPPGTPGAPGTPGGRGQTPTSPTSPGSNPLGALGGALGGTRTK
jgi:prepilin-type N-terminal cleavage/methylation domain-containing protein